MSLTVRNSRFRRWAGNVLAVCLGIGAMVLLVALAEGLLRLKAHMQTPADSLPVVGKMTGAISHEGILGVEGTPNGVIRCVAARGDRVLYDTSCRTDSAGRRFVPCDCRDDNAGLALFFGCSMTFGLGVADEETLPARYCAHTPNCDALNYGLAGWGPQQMWLQICKQGVLKPFHSRKGVIVYTFIDDHVNRLAGTANIVSEWPYPLPWLSLNKGHIEYGGTFFDRSPAQYLFLHYIDRMHLARFIENHIPRRQSDPLPDAAVELLAKLVEECSATAKTEAPGLSFCCLVFPKFFSCNWGADLAARLRAANVHVLDYSDLLENTPQRMEDLFFDDNTLYRWGHPKAAVYDFMAQRLSRDIAANEKQPAGGV